MSLSSIKFYGNTLKLTLPGNEKGQILKENHELFRPLEKPIARGLFDTAQDW